MDGPPHNSPSSREAELMLPHASGAEPTAEEIEPARPDGEGGSEDLEDLKKFARGMPKVELHLHLEGTLRPELQIELAQRNGLLGTLRHRTVEDLQRAYDFEDLASFLELYYEGCSVLRTEGDFYDLTFSCLRRAHEDNVRHAEVMFDPQVHMERGLEFDTIVNGVHRALCDGKEKFGITSGLIMCFVRDLSAQSAMSTLKDALRHRDKIMAVGLDSHEMGNPPEKFEEVFNQARKEGFLAVAHAGEEGPPSYIWEALDCLRVRRVDHGVRCLEDPKLVVRLVQEQVPLTVCPMSNVRLRVFDRMEDHNVKKLLDKGLCVTVNSDDPAYFGGFINANFVEILKLGLNRLDLVRLGRNGIKAAFLAGEERQRLTTELDRYLRSYADADE